MASSRDEPRLELGVHVFVIMWNSLDNAHSSIVFCLEMKVEVEVGVHDIRSRFIPRASLSYVFGLKKVIIGLSAFHEFPLLLGFNLYHGRLKRIIYSIDKYDQLLKE